MYADNVAIALYLCAAVRRAAVYRYFLLVSAAFAAVAHAGTDRQTDTLLFYRRAPLLPQIGDLITARKLKD